MKKIYIITTGVYEEKQTHGACLTLARAAEVLEESRVFAEDLLKRMTPLPRRRFDPETGEELDSWMDAEKIRYQENSEAVFPYGIYWGLCSSRVLPEHPARVEEMEVI